MTNNDLFVAVDEILCYTWDPLGVSADGTPQTRDEYTSYVPKIVESLERDGSAEVIADILNDIEDRYMELKPKNNKNIKIAELLLEKRRFLLEE